MDVTHSGEEAERAANIVKTASHDRMSTLEKHTGVAVHPVFLIPI